MIHENHYALCQSNFFKQVMQLVGFLCYENRVIVVEILRLRKKEETTDDTFGSSGI